MTRRLVALASVALMFLGLAVPAASAVPPEMFTDQWVDYWYIGECDGFSMVTEDNMEAQIKVFHNKDGSVDRVHFKFTIDGIVFNSEDDSKSLASGAHYTALTDEHEEVWTQSGLYYRVELAQGNVFMDAGRFIVDVSSGEPVFDWQGGNHQILEEDFAEICEALS